METGGGLAANLHIKEQGQAGVCADEKNNTSCDFEKHFAAPTSLGEKQKIES